MGRRGRGKRNGRQHTAEREKTKKEEKKEMLIGFYNEQKGKERGGGGVKTPTRADRFWGIISTGEGGGGGGRGEGPRAREKR